MAEILAHQQFQLGAAGRELAGGALPGEPGMGGELGEGGITSGQGGADIVAAENQHLLERMIGFAGRLAGSWQKEQQAEAEDRQEFLFHGDDILSLGKYIGFRGRRQSRP